MPGKHPIFLIHQADSVANETLGDSFLSRHIGPNPDEIQKMLGELGYTTMESFIGDAVPFNIRIQRELNIGKGISEREVLLELKELSRKNKTFRQFIGMGYADCMTPSVILRNIMENPGWYTQYTPYQSEISQGRLEALLNFQTMIADLTGLPVANASLLDEATASAEALHMAYAIKGERDEKRRLFFISESCHPQTIAVVETRARPLGIQVVVGDHRTVQFDEPILGALVQYPDTNGIIENYADFAEKVKKGDGLLVVVADLLSLLLLRPPGEWGADIAVGGAQRFGVPLGYGGPHAAFLSTRDEYKRKIPGRIVGLSKDAEGRPAIRLALQTREQHIRREKATSNICTAQVLLAVMASMYAVYHGPKGLKKIASRVHTMACRLKRGFSQLGIDVLDRPFFDTLKIPLDPGIAQQVMNLAVNR
ncbi:MAG: glycine dehydrogenase (aminomethyl-transferring), partial [Deltaproteobacteria bacterium]|nr:glycine dehydrogenase (aminomethyl-transferring) [Deltaproteobacteria bacterium]